MGRVLAKEAVIVYNKDTAPRKQEVWCLEGSENRGRTSINIKKGMVIRMKKHFFRWTAVLLLMLVLMMAASCGDSQDPVSSDTSDDPGVDLPPVVFMEGGVSDYTVVSSASYGATALGKEALTRFRDMVEENSGTPFTYANDSAAAAAHEILLGETNREETKEAQASLREKDYIILVKNGKLVAVGGSKESTYEAIVRFGKMFFSQPQTDLVLREGTVYEYRADYAIGDVTLAGCPLRDYTLVYSGQGEADAIRMAADLRSMYGWVLPIVSEEKAEGNRVIRLSVEGEADGWSLALTDSGLAVKGGSNEMLSYAASHFVDLMKKQENQELSVGYTLTGSFEAGADLRLFDLNVYFSGYGTNSVANRFPRLMKLIGESDPDVITLQDVSPAWLACLKNGDGTVKALTDTYGFVGVGRNNDDKSVMHPIFYKKDKYTLTDSGAFWLSATPQWESVGWDGYTRCVCTWAILTDKASGASFAVMNTQFDPNGKNAQANGGALVASRAQEFGLPVLFGGDFQAGANGRAFRGMGNFLLDSVTLSQREGDKSMVTVNNAFGDAAQLNRATDFVMVSRGDFLVRSHTTVTDLVEGGYASNHWPIVVDLTVKKQ